MSHLTKERLDELRSEYNQRNRLRNGSARYPRQKMLPEYQFLYPWVMPDEEDPYFTFCTVCECRLSAKRSDLGKHESSLKHKDNVSKKGIAHIAINSDTLSKISQAPRSNEQMKMDLVERRAESDEEDDEKLPESDGGPHIKNEPVEDLIENSNDILSINETRVTTFAKLADDEDDDDDDDSEECDDEYSPAAKRQTYETDCQSQNFSINTTSDNFPVLSVRDARSGQNFSIRQLSSATSTGQVSTTQQYARPQDTQKPSPAPCKITIKKITPPITPNTAPQVTSTAKITQLSGAAAGILQTNAKGFQSPSSVTPPVRDSFELFFDSVCASVKELPPKLATEGKIRVMQLIGELELRAITEREQKESHEKNQQNSIVASTTK